MWSLAHGGYSLPESWLRGSDTYEISGPTVLSSGVDFRWHRVYRWRILRWGRSTKALRQPGFLFVSLLQGGSILTQPSDEGDMAMRRVSILVSGKEFLWVTFKKSIPLLLFASLDIFDIWDRYIGPRILELTGRDIALPSNWLLVLLGLGILCSAILTYHELTKRKVALEADLEPTVSIDDTPLLRVWKTRSTG